MKRKIVLPPEVKNFFVNWGAVGGSSKSKEKIEASRKNGASPCKPGKFRGRPKKNQSNGNSLKSVHE